MLNKKNQKLNLIFKIEGVKSFYEIKFGDASLLLSKIHETDKKIQILILNTTVIENVLLQYSILKFNLHKIPVKYLLVRRNSDDRKCNRNILFYQNFIQMTYPTRNGITLRKSQNCPIFLHLLRVPR